MWACVFYSGASGTSGSRIVLKGCDPANPPILQGPATNDGSYGIHLTGDYWEISDINVTRAQKGIIEVHPILIAYKKKQPLCRFNMRRFVTC